MPSQQPCSTNLPINNKYQLCCTLPLNFSMVATFDIKKAKQLLRTESHSMDVVREQAVSLAHNMRALRTNEPHAVLEQLSMQFLQLMVAVAGLDFALGDKMQQLLVLANFSTSQTEAGQVMMGYVRSLEGWALFLSGDLAHVCEAAHQGLIDVLPQDRNINLADTPAYLAATSLIGAVTCFKQTLEEQLLAAGMWATLASISSVEIKNAAPKLIKLGNDLLNEGTPTVVSKLHTAASRRRQLMPNCDSQKEFCTVTLVTGDTSAQSVTAGEP